MRKRFTFPLLALVPLAPVAAQSPRAVMVDGVRVDYTSSLDADGVLHFKGRDGYRDEELDFRLLANGWLVGHVGGRQIRVRIDRAQRERAILQLARRPATQHQLASAD